MLDALTSYAAAAARPYIGNFHVDGARLPEQPLELYEFEGCPYCRLAREAASSLSLPLIVYPCPKGGERFRPTAIARSGARQFPFLVDPNTGTELLESAEIVRYLHETYGTGTIPKTQRFRALSVTTSSLASGMRPLRGMRARPSVRPEAQIELYGYEGSPYCRFVRETLCELEIPYRLHNIPRRSPLRTAYIDRVGKMQVPWLRDPNTGVEMFESREIAAYLERTYGR